MSMETFETLKVTVDDRGVVSLCLNRADKKNAMSGQMIEELSAFAAYANSQEDWRVVVLSGEGSIFCAGGDLGWMMQQIKSDRAGRMAEARKLAYTLKDLNEMRLPMIGRVHGGAFGGGLGVMSVCDVVIAEENVKFGFTEAKLGLIPATISPYVLARMGEGNARRVFMSARLFGAAEARVLGLVARVVSEADLEAAVEAEVAPYLVVAPHAVGASKALARRLGPVIDEAVIEDTIGRLADTWEGKEAREGIDAFLTKRKARWA